MTVTDALLAPVLAADPARPLVTFYDDTRGERIELSGQTFDNWVAKTANLLVDGHGLGEGHVAVVRLPPHWQSAVVLLGAWTAGLSIDIVGTPSAGATASPGPPGPGSSPTSGGSEGDIAFVLAAAPAHLTPTVAPETFVLALDPFAMPMRPGPPPGTLDYVLEVRAHGDHFTPTTPVRPDSAALTVPADPGQTVTHAALVERAAHRATAAGLAPAARVLIDADTYPDVVDWLLAPLAAGASIVLCRRPDPARLTARLASERATIYAIA